MAQGAFRRDPHQPVGDLLDPFLQLGLLRLPGPAAQTVEQALFMAIAAEKLDVLDRQVKLCILGIFQHDAGMRRAKGGDRLDPEIAPDAMLDMHHQIAGRQRIDLAQEVVGLALAAWLGRKPFAQHILFGDHRKPGRDEPRLQRPDDKEKPALAFRHRAEVGDLARAGQAVVGEKSLQPLPRAFGPRGDDHLPRLRQDLNMLRQGAEKIDLLLLSLGREVPSRPRARVQHPRPRTLRQGRQLHHAARGQRRFPGGIVQIQLLGRDRLVDRVDAALGPHRLMAGIVTVGDPLPPGQPGRGHLVIQHHRGTGQVVEEGLQPLMEEGQPMLHPLMLPPCAHRFVERIVRSRRTKGDAVVLPEPRDCRLVEDHLGNSGKVYAFQLFRGPLRLRVEAPRPVQHIAEEIQPDWPARPRRVDVDDPAAQGEVSRLGDSGDRREPHPREEPFEPRLVHPIADRGAERRGPHHRPHRHLLHRRVQRGQQHERPRQPIGQCRQRRHPPRRDLGVRAHAVVRQAVPGRKVQHRDFGCHNRQRRAHRLGPLVVAGDMHDRLAPRKLADQDPGVEAFGRPAHQDAFGSHGSGESVSSGWKR